MPSLFYRGTKRQTKKYEIIFEYHGVRVFESEASLYESTHIFVVGFSGMADFFSGILRCLQNILYLKKIFRRKIWLPKTFFCVSFVLRG